MSSTLVDWLTQNWNRFVALLSSVHKKISQSLLRSKANRKGKKLAIVGPMASGKTVVHTFLATGVLLSEYSPTLGVEKREPTKVEIEKITDVTEHNPIKLFLAERLDVTGDFKAVPDAWRKALSDTFFVVFLFDMKKFLDEGPDGKEYRRLVVDGCDFAGGLITHQDAKVVFAGTHCDQIADWSLTQQGANKINQRFWKYDEAQEAATHLAKETIEDANVVVGSLAGERNATEFLYSIFE